MSKWIEVRRKSVLPWYFAGLVWLVGALALPIYQLWALVVVAVLSVVGFVAARRVCPDVVTRKEVPFMTGKEDADQMLALIDQKRRELHELNVRIEDAPLSAAMDRMEKACLGILNEVEQHPEKAAQVRRFANYYLQDAVKILTLYAELEEKGVQGENAAGVRAEVAQNAQTIATAFENQLDSLFARDALDISTDLEVLNGMLKGQGLVD
ncbi:5-bromo-4-chloroindolyl phosphate hydrolysis family protein [Allofournierella massiliensis]|uniref:5-bromo-4-chloroindolyl phosphate hydrolysis protein n=1 Tax=Allofournierella massiliensis TaxID=1650663 RepID=A0A4R1QMP9_9FIRM|nr:5-bromo-4-chloroindolyl phosphate hydrolysis family protein [Fournierella massiliensis]TCL54547.1 5-bromo-4-chloroindolyl phosphate hydrolysis protein [Fournierella massiliensis]